MAKKFDVLKHYLLLPVLVMMACFFISINSNAASTGKVYVTVEKFTIGQGYLVEPCEVTFTEGDTCLQILNRVLKANGYEVYIKAGTTGYVEGIKNADTGNVKVPSCIINVSEWGDIVYPNSDKDLDELDYNYDSGWYYFVNNEAPGVTPDGRKVHNGDVIRLCFTLYGNGTDLKGKDNYYYLPNLDSLIKSMAIFNANKQLCVEKGYQAAYKEALQFASDMDAHVITADNSNKRQIEAKMQSLCSKLPTEAMINQWKAEKEEAAQLAAAKAEEARKTSLYTPSAPKTSSVKSTKSRTAVITWKKNKNATGYEVYMSTKKSSGYKKIAILKKWNKVTYTKKKLKKGKKYYFKVRAYKTAEGKKYYSAYSKVKSVKVK